MNSIRVFPFFCILIYILPFFFIWTNSFLYSSSSFLFNQISRNFRNFSRIDLLNWREGSTRRGYRKGSSLSEQGDEETRGKTRKGKVVAVICRPGDHRRRHRGGTDTWAWPLAAGYKRQIARAKGENREILYSCRASNFPSI